MTAANSGAVENTDDASSGAIVNTSLEVGGALGVAVLISLLNGRYLVATPPHTRPRSCSGPRIVRGSRGQGPHREQRPGAPACLGSAPAEGARSRPNTRPTGPDTAPEQWSSASRSARSSRRARSMTCA